MAPPQPVWKICLGQLSQNLQEAAELANVLQEVSSSIQVTGLTRTLTARTSTSSGNPTHLSARERIKRAVPLVIESGAVPWSQLVAVVSSASLQEPNSPTSRKQPQVLEVNSGGAVYFLFFKLRPAGQQQQSQQQQSLQQEQQQVLQLQPLPQLKSQHGSAAAEQDCCAVTQQQREPRDGEQGCSVVPLPMHQLQQPSQTQLQQPTCETCIQQATPQDVQQRPAQVRTAPSALADELPLGQLSDQQAAVQQAAQGGSPFETSANGLPSQPTKQGQHQQQQQHGRQQLLLPFLQLHQQRITAREGVAVLKVGASRLAMQAEQFANELTRHLGIAAPDCRIVRQVGSSDAEWSAVLAAVQQLAEPQHNIKPVASGSSGGGSACSADAVASHSKMVQGPPAGNGSSSSKGSSCGASNGSGGGSSGCQVAADLLAELSHLPCFLLMEFMEGSKLSDCPHALDPAVSDVGQLCEDVGRLFLLDMLLGNADRMSCPELGWRGNANNLLYAQPGSRHAGRAVAIDSCVARRPPALKASAEDAAVERLSQLVLAVPGVSLALVQQLLGALREQQQQRQRRQQRRQQSLPGAVGLCTALSIEDFGGSSCGQAGLVPAGGVSGGGGAAGGGEAAAAGQQLQQQHKQQGDCVSGAGGAAAGSAVGSSPSHALLALSLSCKSSAAGSVAQAGARSGAALLEADTGFSEQEVARFQAGLRQCLDGVLQIKGLLEMVSGKIADWIAEFVEDVVRLNPALLPNPTSPSPAALMRSPKPSPRVSGRGSFSNIKVDPLTLSSGSNSSSIGGAQDAAAAAALPSAGAGPGSVANGSSTSTSSRLSAPALTGPGNLVDASASRSAAGPQPEAAALPPTWSPAAAAAPAPPAASTGGVEQQSTVSEVVQHSPAAAAEDPGRAGHEDSSAAGMSSTPPRSLFKQLVGHSKGGKKAQVPLTHRFAAIKAAICSPTSSSSSSSSKESKPARSPQPQQPPADASSSSPVLPPTHGPSAAPDDMGTPPAATHTTSQHCSTPCSPPTRSPGSRSDPPAGTEGPRSSSSDLATAVAAALSPRATAAQAEVLAGLFGGRSPSGRLHRSLNGAMGSSSSMDWGEGGVGGAVCVLKPPCARRVTWSAADEPCGAGPSAAGVVSGGGRLLGKACGASILEPPAHKSLLSSGAPGYISPSEALPVAGWSSPSAALPPIAGSPSRVPLANPGSNNSNTSGSSSRNSSSSPVPGPGHPHQPAGSSPFAPAAAGREHGQGLPSCSPTPPSGPPGHFDNLSFLHRQHNTRHLSFTSGGGGGGEGGGGNSPAAVSVAAPQQQHPAQQRSSSSSLQVLASLQLDATLASITQEARHDGAERLAWWKAKFKERGAELSAAIASWQQRHQLAAVLSTGFLDGSHPIVDAYELGVRLQHMLRRLTALAAGALVQVPIMVLPGVFLGNAVAADSHHLLQYLGVTHVLNAAAELQLTPDAGMFHVLRVAIRDEEEEDVAAHFTMAQDWIDAALSSGGAVLVHCHEGKSRSVTLLLAYLMLNRGLTLAAALLHMRSVQPKACPNAGFMAQLMRLDQSLHGTCSIQPSELPRAKPEARICSICGAPAGISYASLVRHTKAKHGLAKPPVAPAASAAANAAAAGGTTL